MDPKKVNLSEASLASATEGGTIRGGTHTNDSDVEDGMDPKKVTLSVASLASATEGATIRGGTHTNDSDVKDGRDPKKVKKNPKMVPMKKAARPGVLQPGGPQQEEMGRGA